MRNSLICFCLLTLFLGAPCALLAKSGAATTVSLKEASELLKRPDIIILDVRTPAEFAQGHLPGARNLDFFGGRFDHEVANLPRNKQVLLYCRSGKRSAGAAEALDKAGIERIMDMYQGFNAWEKAGLPIEK